MSSEDQTAIALLGGKKKILGYAVNPMTLAVIAVMKKLDSPFVSGSATEADIEREGVIEYAKLFMLLRAEPEKLLSYSEDAKTLNLDAMRLLSEVQPAQLPELMEGLNSMLEEMQKTKPVIEPSKGGSGGKKKGHP